MKNLAINEEITNVSTNILRRENQENIAIASLSADTLSKLNVTIDALPQNTQQLLHNAASGQAALDINQLDPIVISLLASKNLLKNMEEDYEILNLQQKNAEVQRKIDCNNKFLEGLRKELIDSKRSMQSQNPNPDNVQDVIRQLKQKVASYEESCERAKMKFTKLNVPEGVYPKALQSLVASLAALQAEAASLEQRASDIVLAREARDNFNRLINSSRADS